MYNYHDKYIKYKKKYLDLKHRLINQYGGHEPLRHIITPINGPKEITIILKPFLVYDGNIFHSNHKTGIDKVDNIIEKRIAVDYTKIKKILPFYYESAYAWFDSGFKESDLLEKNVKIETIDYQFKNGLIYLKVKKSNNNGFNKNDYKAIRICFDPHDFGPDGYMLQDITIYSGPELEPFINKIKQKKLKNSLVDNGNKQSNEYTVELAVEVKTILP